MASAGFDKANTFRTCSSSGCLSSLSGLAGLSIRRWTCSTCGPKHDRDQNAACNSLFLHVRRRA
ncbi:zinc ribbon domain-containing protein [Methylobacterium radiotolerans]|uniref:zinc ribbon domain-containing protein n=1 Tax=Methylobacterium radiotolerans TaxID=31998 RepID=UPI00399C5BBD